MLRPSLPTSNNLGSSQTAAGNLRLPKLTHHDTIIAAVPRKIYANGMPLSFYLILQMAMPALLTLLFLISACLSYQLYIHQLGWRDLHIC